MLLFFRASGATEATLGINFGLTAVATATAALGISLGLSSPASAELNVSATPSITLGLTGNNIPVSEGSALLSTSLGLTGAGGYAASTAFSTQFGLSGTVGSFLDGEAILTHSLSLSGDAHPLTDASVAINFGLSGLPDITGGTIESAATAGIVFDLSVVTGFVDFVTMDLNLGLQAIGTAQPGVNSEAVLTPMRPRTTLRSFLIGT